MSGHRREPGQQLGLFAPTSALEDRIAARLRELDVNRLTPLEALTLLADLKRDAERLMRMRVRAAGLLAVALAAACVGGRDTAPDVITLAVSQLPQ